jgi:hypothetical protein
LNKIKELLVLAIITNETVMVTNQSVDRAMAEEWRMKLERAGVEE